MKLKFILFLLLLSPTAFSYENYSELDFKGYSTDPHEVKILNHGLAALEERLQLIESAQDSIDVEYYIFKQDLASQIISRALLQKVKEGVRVRILIDYFANRKSPNPHVLGRMQEEGIEVKFFNTSPLVNIYNVQYRNHRKALIVDNKTAIIGGRNVANEYFDLSEYYNFLDRDMSIHGSIVETISRTFESNFTSRWASILKSPKKPDPNDFRYREDDYYHMSHSKYDRDLKRWLKNEKDAEKFLFEELDIQEIRNLGRSQLFHSHAGTCNKLKFISEVPSFGRKRKYSRLLKEVIQDKIENAKTNIIIESPYFILTDEFKKVVDKTLDSKVNIKLLTNSINSTDQIFVYSAFESQLYGLLHQHLDTYIANGKRPENYEVLERVEYANYGIHSKTFVFDNEDFIISTFNLDPRSSDINAELLILCEDSPELALLIKKDIEERMKETYRINSAGDLFNATYKEGTFRKVIYYLLSKIPAQLIKPFL